MKSIIAREFRGSVLYLRTFNTHSNAYDWSNDKALAYRFDSQRVARQTMNSATDFCGEGKFYVVTTRDNGVTTGVYETAPQAKKRITAQLSERPVEDPEEVPADVLDVPEEFAAYTPEVE